MSPNKPRTPLRSFRAPDPLWDDAKLIAAARGEDLSGVLRAALEAYVKRNRHLLDSEGEQT